MAVASGSLITVYGTTKAMSILYFIIIGIVAGWLAGMIMRGGGFGLFGDLILGIIGAVVGGHFLGALGISFGGDLGAIITATIGACVLIGVVRLIKRA